MVLVDKNNTAGQMNSNTCKCLVFKDDMKTRTTGSFAYLDFVQLCVQLLQLSIYCVLGRAGCCRCVVLRWRVMVVK